MLDLFKIASRVAILFGGPQYKYFKDIEVGVDRHTTANFPHFIFKGTYVDDQGNEEHKKFYVIFDFHKDTIIGVDDIEGNARTKHGGRLGKLQDFLNQVDDDHQIWQEMTDIIHKSDIFQVISKAFSDPTPEQKQAFDTSGDNTVVDQLLPKQTF